MEGGGGRRGEKNESPNKEVTRSGARQRETGRNKGGGGGGEGGGGGVLAPAYTGPDVLRLKN